MSAPVMGRGSAEVAFAVLMLVSIVIERDSNGELCCYRINRSPNHEIKVAENVRGVGSIGTEREKLTFTPIAEIPNLLANVSGCRNLGNG